MDSKKPLWQLCSFALFLLCSLVACAAIAVFYCQIVSSYAPLALDWIPWHQNFVRSAAEHLTDDPFLLSAGVVRANLDFSSSIYAYDRGTYHVPAFQFIFPALLIKFNGIDMFSRFMPKYHFFVSCSIGYLLAVLTVFSGIPKVSLNSTMSPAEWASRMNFLLSIFLIYTFSVWTYRSLLAPWQELHFLFFLLVSFAFLGAPLIPGPSWVSTTHARFLWGMVLIFIACLNQYQWGFFLSLYYFCCCLFYRHIAPKRLAFYLPRLVLRRGQVLILALVCLAPSLVSILQVLYVRSMGYEPENSSAIARIGIDAVASMHYGGFLSSLQYLGGNRITLCIANLDQSMLGSKISAYNCLLTYFSMVALSLAAISALAWRLWRKNLPSSWLIFPILISFLLFNSIFQQSFSVHLQGYSLLFSCLFSVGISLLIRRCLWVARTHFVALPLLAICMYVPIVLTLLKSSYLTPTGG